MTNATAWSGSNEAASGHATAGTRSRINARCSGEREVTGACEQLGRRTAAAARATLAECLTRSSSTRLRSRTATTDQIGAPPVLSLIRQ
jgi:hypothetical protein